MFSNYKKKARVRNGLYQRFSNMTELKCSNCGGDIGAMGVMSPTLEKKRRHQCMKCATEWMKELHTTKTMDDFYGDGSDHEVCSKCGFCKSCKDCNCEEKIFEVGKAIPKVWLHMEFDFDDTIKYLNDVVISDDDELKRLKKKYLE